MTLDIQLSHSDQILSGILSTLPEELNHMILSSFATQSFENLKCVTLLSTGNYTFFAPILFKSLELNKEQGCLSILWSIDAIGNQQDESDEQITNHGRECRKQHERFGIIASSTKKLSITHEEVIKALGNILKSPINYRLFKNVDELIIRNLNDRNNHNMHLPNDQYIKTIFNSTLPKKVCLDLGIPFANTWKRIINDLSQGSLDSVEEFIQHGIPISNLEVKLIILNDIKIQRFFLEDYIVPSIGQTSLCIQYEMSSSQAIFNRILPEEIHVYANWNGIHGLPLKLVDSNIPYMTDLRKLTFLHDFEDHHVCEICGKD
ncbi:uncharacterized protein I206_104544 [Kwoniella pini CBS 10737]|uniref:F-box domain-containing protein n=1 Tax=Kwoniella pini CBS 10737 TaxID=1296096 RepID=A0A1B9I738_9TREE|nr:uncharacterized protein I206_02077 [Kwoniella pini CBS 10737]OCF51363.1 hypothetical protein I206_02077 [Kwoniella pini CBS 10737]